MSRTSTVSEAKSKSDPAVHSRVVKDEANTTSTGRADKPSTKQTLTPRKIHIGWSLLAFAAFCLVAWGLIFLALRFVL